MATASQMTSWVLWPRMPSSRRALIRSGLTTTSPASSTTKTRNPAISAPVREGEPGDAAHRVAREAGVERVALALRAQHRPRMHPTHGASLRVTPLSQPPPTRSRNRPHLRHPLGPPLLLEARGAGPLQQCLGRADRPSVAGQDGGHEVGGGGVELAARYDGGGDAQVAGLVALDVPRGRTDLQRPRVANKADQRFCSREVRHQAQRRLLHAEAHVVRGHPQVAGQRQLEARPDGIALDLRDRDEARVGQPDEPALVAVDGLGHDLVGLLHQLEDGVLALEAVGREQAGVQAGREVVAGPLDHDHANLVRDGGTDLGERVPHPRGLAVALARLVERHGQHGTVVVQGHTGLGQSFGGHDRHGRSLVTRSTARPAAASGRACRSACPSYHSADSRARQSRAWVTTGSRSRSVAAVSISSSDSDCRSSSNAARPPRMPKSRLVHMM